MTKSDHSIGRLVMIVALALTGCGGATKSTTTETKTVTAPAVSSSTDGPGSSGNSGSATTSTGSVSAGPNPSALSGLVQQIDTVLTAAYAGGDADVTENCPLVGSDGTVIAINGPGATALCGGWDNGPENFAAISWSALTDQSATTSQSNAPAVSPACELISTTATLNGSIVISPSKGSTEDAQAACTAFTTEGPWASSNGSG